MLAGWCSDVQNAGNHMHIHKYKYCMTRDELALNTNMALNEESCMVKKGHAYNPTTACTVRWSFCDSGFAIMVLKAPSEPSGSQELQARRAAPGPHGTHPPSHSACGCQPSFRFSAAGLFHPACS